MRKVTQQIKDAFEQGKAKKVGNTETDGKTVWLHGNAIVKRDPDGLVRWSLAGWNTTTTRRTRQRHSQCRCPSSRFRARTKRASH